VWGAYNESIIERSIDMHNSKNKLSFLDVGGSEGLFLDNLFNDLSSFLSFAALVG
jgi:hypothetical protein